MSLRTYLLHTLGCGTPTKVVFTNLRPSRVCFSCGKERPHRHTRCLNNMAIKGLYLQLVKEVLLVELPNDCPYRLCEICIHTMQKTLVWRNEAIERLQSLTSKREIGTLNTPSPPHKYKCAVPTTLVHTSESEHQYARMAMDDRSRKERVGFRERTRRSLCDTGDEPLMAKVRKCSSVSELVTLCTATPLKETIEDGIIQRMNSQLQSLCNTGEFGSVLSTPTTDTAISSISEKAIEELRKCCPFLYKVLLMASSTTTVEKKDDWHLFTLYGILMQRRSQRFNVLQRLVMAACIRHHAGNELIELLHRLHVCQAEGSKYQFLESMALKANQGLVRQLASRNCKVTVDNIDGRMIANQVRVCSGNKDYHYTHWTVYPDRFHEEDLRELDTTRNRQGEGPPIELFYCSQHEENLIRYSYSIYAARILCDEVDCLRVLKNAVPNVIPHKWSDVVSRESDVYAQQIILENSNSLPSCVTIMDKISESLSTLYHKAGRGEEYDAGTIRTTVGGDQLTRCHLDSAKGLRAGVHSPVERFDHLSPVIEEIFHVQQDLLEKIFKKFYSNTTSLIGSTLTNLRAELHRTNVNGAVKENSAYEAHKDFAVLVSRMLLVEKFLEQYGLAAVNEHIDMPTHIKTWSNQKKLDWLMNFLRPLVDGLFVSFRPPNMEPVHVPIIVYNAEYNLVLPPTYRGKNYEFTIGEGVMVRIPIPEEPREVTVCADELNNYATSFLRVMLDFIMLDESTRAADVDRVTACFKRLVPTFVGLTSYRSKYFIELVNSLTKTEYMLSPRQSVAVKLHSFVNLSGQPGCNKPADMQQEINIKQVKQVMKGLGASKTDKAMVRASQAAQTVASVTEMFRTSVGLKPHSSRFSHHKKDDSEDKAVVMDILREARPFNVQPNRRIGLECQPSIPHAVDKHSLNNHILPNAKRAVMQLDVFDEGEES